MAILTKSRARKPLAAHMLQCGWSSGGDDGERFNLRVLAETEHSYSLAMSRKEVLSFMSFVTEHETFVYGRGDGGMGFSDKRTLAEKLRAFADKLEAE